MLGSFSVFTVSGKRKSAPSNSEGTFVPGVETDISFKASVQPITGKELMSLPEGRREKENYNLFTDFSLRTVDEDGNTNPDTVTLFGKDFEIIRVDVWQNKVIPHYRAIASSING